MREKIFIIVIYLITVNIFVSPVIAKSRKKIISQAEQGDAQAQYELATMYENGRGVNKSIEDALKWFRLAAKNGHVGSMVDLGWFYQNGQHVEKDVNKALEWYEDAAERGDAQGQHNLAVIYDQGIDVPKNNDLAMKWYEKAAHQGHGVAQLNMGIKYLKGDGVEQDNEKAWVLLNLARMNPMNKNAQWRARGLLSEMKQKLRIKAGECSYPAWKNLKYRDKHEVEYTMEGVDLGDGLEEISMLKADCKTPYRLTQDCSWATGAKRKIKIKNYKAQIAGTEDGKVVLIERGNAFGDARGKKFKAAIAEIKEYLKENGIRVKKIKYRTTMGDPYGYYFELDGDGYSLLRQHTI